MTKPFALEYTVDWSSDLIRLSLQITQQIRSSFQVGAKPKTLMSTCHSALNLKQSVCLKKFY